MYALTRVVQFSVENAISLGDTTNQLIHDAKLLAQGGKFFQKGFNKFIVNTGIDQQIQAINLRREAIASNAVLLTENLQKSVCIAKEAVTFFI